MMPLAMRLMITSGTECHLDSTVREDEKNNRRISYWSWRRKSSREKAMTDTGYAFMPLISSQGSTNKKSLGQHIWYQVLLCGTADSDIPTPECWMRRRRSRKLEQNTRAVRGYARYAYWPRASIFDIRRDWSAPWYHHESLPILTSSDQPTQNHRVISALSTSFHTNIRITVPSITGTKIKTLRELKSKSRPGGHQRQKNPTVFTNGWWKRLLFIRGDRT